MAVDAGHSAGRVVDVHAHVVVPGFADVAWADGVQLVTLEGKTIRSALREFVRLDRILEEQDAAGVDEVVLCPWVPLLGRDPDRQNEALAGLVGPRVAALGTVDLERPEQLVELMRDGRLSGVEVPTSVAGSYLGDDRFRDFWAAAEQTAAVVLVHPTTRGFDNAVFDDYYLWNTVGNPLETVATAASMVFAGVLEAHPGLRVILVHGGGGVTALRGRLEHAHGFQPQARARLSEPPVESLRRFFYDTVTHDVEVLRELVSFVGAERVVCGSDYPFDMGLEHPAEVVRALGLSADDETAILSGNADRLLARPG